MVTIKAFPGNHADAVQAAKSAWKQFFPNEPFEYTFMDDTFNRLYKSDILTSRLMLIFSILAIVIAVLGLFGLSTFAIERRTKEIGIRKVFGASIYDIVYLLSKDFLILVLISIAVASPVAWWVMEKWLTNYAYRTDIPWWLFVVVGGISLCIALLTVGFQAIKAAMENPVNAIKSE